MAPEAGVERARALNALVAEAVPREPAEMGSGPLAGVVAVVKDCFYDRGRTPTMGSRLLPPAREATAVALDRLRAAGASITAYANLHEWAVGMTSVFSALGPIANPHDPARIAGGSSGGSAVAVAAGAADLALGTDAGGSIRCPAACCGVVGFKPTFGAVPAAGAVGEDSELSCIGPLARHVAGTAAAFAVLAGRAPAAIDPSGLTVAVAGGFFTADLAPAVAGVLARAAKLLAGLCRSAIDVDVAGAELAGPAVSVLHLSHTAALVGRALAERATDLHPKTAAVLERGRRYGPQDLARARRTARVVTAGFARVFERADVVLTPTLPAPAAPIATRLLELPSGPASAERAYLAFNAPMSLAGLPALSLPAGRWGDLPVGVTLTGRAGEDAVVLAAAAALETALTTS